MTIDLSPQRYAFTFAVGLFQNDPRPVRITVNAESLVEAKDRVAAAIVALGLDAVSRPSYPEEMREIEDD